METMASQGPVSTNDNEYLGISDFIIDLYFYWTVIIIVLS